jgi:hypothetical protein
MPLLELAVAQLCIAPLKVLRLDFGSVHLVLSCESCLSAVLYAEMIPKGEEVLWFSLQLVLSWATTRVTYVATGPLQNATHNLRLLLISCIIFFNGPLVLECAMYWLPYFQRDRARWQELALANVDDGSSKEDNLEKEKSMSNSVKRGLRSEVEQILV